MTNAAFFEEPVKFKGTEVQMVSIGVFVNPLWSRSAAPQCPRTVCGYKQRNLFGFSRKLIFEWKNL